MRRGFSIVASLAVVVACAGIAVAGTHSTKTVADTMTAGAMTYKIGNPNTGLCHGPPNQCGTITLTPAGGKTKVVINITGEPKGAIEPSHIHKGACKNPGVIVWPLTDVVAGHSTTIVDAPISKVNVAGDSVNIHRSAAQLNQFMACGNVGTSMGSM